MNQAPMPGRGPRRPPRPQDITNNEAQTGLSMSPDAARLVLIQGHLESLGGCITLPELLKRSLASLVEMTNLEGGFVYSVEGDDGTFSMREVAKQGSSLDSNAVSSSILLQALKYPGVPVVSSGQDDVASSASVLDLQIKSYAAFSVEHELPGYPMTRLVFYCDKKFAAQKFNGAMMNSIRNLAFMVGQLLPSALDHDGKYRVFSDLHVMLKAANEQLLLVEDNVAILADAVVDRGLDDEIKGHLQTQAQTLSEISTAVAGNAKHLRL